ncbi:MAG: META domain-containing protein [Actinobacteria bacterium]|nr:META domain-containing protein [Actinomycetota bacterium]
MSTGSPTTTPGPTLDGRSFLSTGATGFEIVSGSVIRLAFSDGTVSASAGCNQMGGAYRLTDGRLHVDSLSMTEMGCEQALMDQDARLADLLTADPGLTLDGDTLMLTAEAGVTVTFLDREVADPDRPLEATRWVVDTVIDGDAASSIPAGAVASITIADGRASVQAGCNTGSASVEIGDGTITFGPLMLTRMACDEAKMALERSGTATIDGQQATYRIEAARLTLMAGEHGLGLSADE